jgi:phage N-6-adenine-methyltransferase
MPSLGNEATVSGTDVWLTPPALLKALGEFDLDPCSPLDRPWDTAKHHYTIEDDGLAQEWFGRVWCNPPYGRAMIPFLRRMVEHKNGLVLIFARTETKAFFDYVWDHADAILFIKGRINFCTPDGKPAGAAGSPSVLIAYGEENVKALETCGIDGKLVYFAR